MALGLFHKQIGYTMAGSSPATATVGNYYISLNKNAGKMDRGSKEFRKEFLTNTDDTGRYIVISGRTGRTYYVEPIGKDRPADWGSVNPATGDMMVKKGWGKNRGSVDARESLITKENGFDAVYELGTGESPTSKIQELDAKYPDKIVG